MREGVRHNVQVTTNDPAWGEVPLIRDGRQTNLAVSAIFESWRWRRSWIVVLLAVEVDLLGVEGISGSSEAEDEEASPTEGEI